MKRDITLNQLYLLIKTIKRIEVIVSLFDLQDNWDDKLEYISDADRKYFWSAIYSERYVDIIIKLDKFKIKRINEQS